MITTCGDSNVVVSIRSCGLTLEVHAPADYRPISLKGKAMIPACGNSDKVVFFGRRSGLTMGVSAPAGYRPIFLKGKTMIVSCGDSNKVGTFRRSGLAVPVVAPSDYTAILT